MEAYHAVDAMQRTNSGQDAPGNKVLVIEDEAEPRRMLQLGLSEYGFEVVVAATGAEALRLFSRELPNLVTLDLTIPGLSGFPLLHALRELPGGQSTPIIVVTGLAFDEARQALAQGADDFVCKPFDFEELARKMHFSLTRPRSRR